MEREVIDEDFRKLFKIKVEFDEAAPINEENVNKLARFVHTFCEQEELPQLDKSAMARIVEYASRIAGDKEKISNRFTDLAEIIGEAGTWAKLSKSKIVTEDFVNKALEVTVFLSFFASIPNSLPCFHALTRKKID